MLPIMLAVLAMTFLLFAAAQQKKVYLDQNPMIRQAVSAIAKGPAVERLEAIRSKGYHQIIVNNEIGLNSGHLAFPDFEFRSGGAHPPGLEKRLAWKCSPVARS